MGPGWNRRVLSALPASFSCPEHTAELPSLSHGRGAVVSQSHPFLSCKEGYSGEQWGSGRLPRTPSGLPGLGGLCPETCVVQEGSAQQGCWCACHRDLSAPIPTRQSHCPRPTHTFSHLCSIPVHVTPALPLLTWLSHTLDSTCPRLPATHMCHSPLFDETAHSLLTGPGPSVPVHS